MMIVILVIDIWYYLCWMAFFFFCSLVSVALCGSQESVVAVGCLIQSASESLPDVATGVPGKTDF